MLKNQNKNKNYKYEKWWFQQRIDPLIYLDGAHKQIFLFSKSAKILKVKIHFFGLPIPQMAA